MVPHKRYSGGFSKGVELSSSPSFFQDIFSDTPDGYDIFGRVGKFIDGRTVAYGQNYIVTTFGGGQGGCDVINVRVPDLRAIDYVLQVNFRMNPLNCRMPAYQAVNKKIIGNVVGMTIFGATNMAGTTLTVEIIAVGN